MGDAGSLYTEILSILKSIQHLDRFMSREVHFQKIETSEG